MDEGSQLVAELVAPPPGGRVRRRLRGRGRQDAGDGAALGGKGRLLALDTDGKKLEELRRRARRAGLTNVDAHVPITGDGAALAARGAARGPRIACWSTRPARAWGRCAATPRRAGVSPRPTCRVFPARQVALLVTYAPLVAVGGRLIYATCIVARAEENERVIERFLAERDDFVRVPVKEIWGKRARGGAGRGG